MLSESMDHMKRLERLAEVCRHLSANLEYEPLLHYLIEVASEITNSERSAILLLDEESHLLRFLAVPWFLKDKLCSATIQADNSFTGSTVMDQKVHAFDVRYSDPNLITSADRELVDDLRNILVVPMVFKGKVIGVVEVTNKSADRDYSEEDASNLETLAALAAVVIRNHSLLEEAESSYKKVIELDRMKSDFLAISSHELRTPLGLILGHTAFLMDSPPEEQKKHISVIENSALRLKEIIEELGDERNIQRGFGNLKRRKVGAGLLVQQVVDSFMDAAREKKIHLSSEGTDSGLTFEGDSEKVAMALQNLIKNSIQFTNAGGIVRVKLEPIPGYVKISVVDNGIGIPVDELGKIFQRFYQVEKHLTRTHGGMGLGLAIAKEMIDLHGGKISVESVEGKGSKFMIILPTNAQQSTAAQKVFLS